MKRRALLSSIGVLGAAGIIGYRRLQRPLWGYPDPPGDATSLAYEVHRRVDGHLLFDQDGYTGLALVTDAAGLDRFQGDWMTAGDEAFFEATDFSTSFILGIQIITSGESTGINVIEVVQTPDGTVHSYSYVARPSMTDDAFPRGFIVRVERTGATPPTSAHHTHRGGNTDLELTATPST